MAGGLPAFPFPQEAILAQAEVDEFWSVLEPIAKSLGLTYSWQREGDGLRFLFTR